MTPIPKTKRPNKKTHYAVGATFAVRGTRGTRRVLEYAEDSNFGSGYRVLLEPVPCPCCGVHERDLVGWVDAAWAQRP